MKLTPQSIRNNVQITWNGEPISKQEILDMSVFWNENQIICFKKILKQGGTIKIENNKFKVTTKDAILNSRGNKDGGIKPIPDPDARF